jgi:hypothetical protein
MIQGKPHFGSPDYLQSVMDGLIPMCLRISAWWRTALSPDVMAGLVPAVRAPADPKRIVKTRPSITVRQRSHAQMRIAE